MPENFKESSDPIADFTSSLIEISKECIPQTSTNPTKSNPWYNDDCKEAIKQRKQALSKFKRSPNTNNFNDIKVFRAKARRTIKLSKRKSWRSYVSKINHKTPIKKVCGSFMFLFRLVFAMFCARLFICALWSPAGKGLTSWLSFVVSSVSLSLSHWYPGSGVVLDCIDS